LFARGVDHIARFATSPRYNGTLFWLALRFLKAAHLASVSSSRTRLTLVVVGHPVVSLPDVRSTEARSAQIDRPAGVTRRFHVRRNKVEPSEAVFACNLLPNNDVRATLADEPVEGGP